MKAVSISTIIGAAVLAAGPIIVLYAVTSPELARPAGGGDQLPRQTPSAKSAVASKSALETMPYITGTDESRNHRGQVNLKIVHFADQTREVTETNYNSNGQADQIIITDRHGRKTIHDFTYAPRAAKR